MGVDLLHIMDIRAGDVLLSCDTALCEQRQVSFADGARGKECKVKSVDTINNQVVVDIAHWKDQHLGPQYFSKKIVSRGPAPVSKDPVKDYQAARFHPKVRPTLWERVAGRTGQDDQQSGQGQGKGKVPGQGGGQDGDGDEEGECDFGGKRADPDDKAPALGHSNCDIGGWKFRIPELNNQIRKLYKRHVAQLWPQIKQLRQKIAVQQEEYDLMEYAQKSGGLDMDGLVDHLCDRNYSRVFERQDIRSKPKISITLVLDDSGSMSGARWHAAMQTSIIIREALRGMDGIEVSALTINKTNLSLGQDRFEAIVSGVYHGGGTPEPQCLFHVLPEVTKRFPDHNRYVFCLNDGGPDDCSDGLAAAVGLPKRMTDGATVIRKLRDTYAAKQTHLFAVGICGAYSEEHGEKAYGKGNCKIIDDIDSTPVLGGWISKKFMELNRLRD